MNTIDIKIDRRGPTGTLTVNQKHFMFGKPFTNEKVVTVNIVFDELVFGWDNGPGVIVTGGAITSSSYVEEPVYEYEILVEANNEGLITIRLVEGAVKDLAMNSNLGGASVSYTYDVTPPRVYLSTSDYTVTEAYTVQTEFSEPVEGFEESDVGFAAKEGESATITFVHGVPTTPVGAVYTFVVTPISPRKPHGVLVFAGGVTDLAGNNNLQSSMLNLNEKEINSISQIEIEPRAFHDESKGEIVIVRDRPSPDCSNNNKRMPSNCPEDPITLISDNYWIGDCPMGRRFESSKVFYSSEQHNIRNFIASNKHKMWSGSKYSCGKLKSILPELKIELLPDRDCDSNGIVDFDCDFDGIPDSNCHYLDGPFSQFYVGTVSKNDFCRELGDCESRFKSVAVPRNVHFEPIRSLIKSMRSSMWKNIDGTIEYVCPDNNGGDWDCDKNGVTDWDCDGDGIPDRACQYLDGVFDEEYQGAIVPQYCSGECSVRLRDWKYSLRTDLQNMKINLKLKRLKLWRFNKMTGSYLYSCPMGIGTHEWDCDGNGIIDYDCNGDGIPEFDCLFLDGVYDEAFPARFGVHRKKSLCECKDQINFRSLRLASDFNSQRLHLLTAKGRDQVLRNNSYDCSGLSKSPRWPFDCDNNGAPDFDCNGDGLPDPWCDYLDGQHSRQYKGPVYRTYCLPGLKEIFDMWAVSLAARRSEIRSIMLLESTRKKSFCEHPTLNTKVYKCVYQWERLLPDENVDFSHPDTDCDFNGHIDYDCDGDGIPDESCIYPDGVFDEFYVGAQEVVVESRQSGKREKSGHGISSSDEPSQESNKSIYKQDFWDWSEKTRQYNSYCDWSSNPRSALKNTFFCGSFEKKLRNAVANAKNGPGGLRFPD
eukprot:GHVL01040181.1.p1 GENE.GHVL01040181.1~~GHVL01040181.1.p1  ORF type:complete len:875 (-),score=120.91 GHVL01040181.1:780-3404(-)